MKKMILLAMAVGALVAFAIPAAASAAPVLVNSAGKAVTFATATQDPTDPVVTTVAGGSVLRCQTIDFGNNITEDTETTAVGAGNGVFSTSGCLANELAPVEITKITVSAIDFTNKTVGTATFSFTFDIPALGLKDCTLSGSIGLKYAHGTNTATITTPNALTGTGTGCPPSGTIKGSFILEDAAGVPIKFT